MRHGLGRLAPRSAAAISPGASVRGASLCSSRSSSAPCCAATRFPAATCCCRRCAPRCATPASARRASAHPRAPFFRPLEPFLIDIQGDRKAPGRHRARNARADLDLDLARPRARRSQVVLRRREPRARRRRHSSRRTRWCMRFRPSPPRACAPRSPPPSRTRRRGGRCRTQIASRDALDDDQGHPDDRVLARHARPDREPAAAATSAISATACSTT